MRITMGWTDMMIIGFFALLTVFACIDAGWMPEYKDPLTQQWRVK